MKKIVILIALAFVTLQAQDVNKTIENVEVNETNATAVVKPYYQGDVVTVEHGGAYSYLEIREHTNETFWVAVNSAEVKVGDYVRFQKELVTKNFKSKALDKTFETLMFGSNLQHKILKGNS